MGGGTRLVPPPPPPPRAVFSERERGILNIGSSSTHQPSPAQPSPALHQLGGITRFTDIKWSVVLSCDVLMSVVRHYFAQVLF